MTGAQASCLRFAGILPGFLSDASRMLANRRQDVGAPTTAYKFPTIKSVIICCMCLTKMGSVTPCLDFG
jgi:hypothetical protein